MIDSLNDTTKKAADIAENYFETSKSYIRLKAFQQLTISIGLISKAFIIGGLMLLGGLFIAIALAWWLGQLIGSIPLGCFIIGILFFVLSYVAYRYRGHVDTQVIKMMSPKFFETP